MENKTIHIPVEDKMSFKFSLFQSNPVKAVIAFQRFLENVQAKKKISVCVIVCVWHFTKTAISFPSSSKSSS